MVSYIQAVNEARTQFMCFEKQPESEHAVLHLDNALEIISNLIEDNDAPSKFKSISTNLTNTYRDLVKKSVLSIIDNKVVDTPVYEHWNSILQIFNDYDLSSSELEGLSSDLLHALLDHYFMGMETKKRLSILNRHLRKKTESEGRPLGP